VINTQEKKLAKILHILEQGMKEGKRTKYQEDCW